MVELITFCKRRFTERYKLCRTPFRRSFTFRAVYNFVAILSHLIP